MIFFIVVISILLEFDRRGYSRPSDMKASLKKRRWTTHVLAKASHFLRRCTYEEGMKMPPQRAVWENLRAVVP
jgi:hypothetical protein